MAAAFAAMSQMVLIRALSVVFKTAIEANYRQQGGDVSKRNQLLDLNSRVIVPVTL